MTNKGVEILYNADFDKVKYNNQFNAAKYDRINLTVPKGNKESIEAHAAEHGESVNAFIRRAITETMDRDENGTK